MPFASASLARRIERVEAALIAEFGRTAMRQLGDDGVSIREMGGGVAVSAGPVAIQQSRRTRVRTGRGLGARLRRADVRRTADTGTGRTVVSRDLGNRRDAHGPWLCPRRVRERLRGSGAANLRGESGRSGGPAEATGPPCALARFRRTAATTRGLFDRGHAELGHVGAR